MPTVDLQPLADAIKAAAETIGHAAITCACLGIIAAIIARRSR